MALERVDIVVKAIGAGKAAQQIDRIRISAAGAAAATSRLENTTVRSGTAVRKAGGNFRRASRDVGLFSKEISTTRKTLSVLRAGLVVFATGFVIQGLLNFADTLTTVRNRIRLVTSNTKELNAVQRGLIDVAVKSRTPLDAVAVLFNRMARSTGHLRYTYQELLNLTEAIALAGTISGATSQEFRNALIQFSQGVAQGKLRGDELRSVSEQFVRLADVVGAAFGVSGAQIIALSKRLDGLPTDKILGELFNQLERLRGEFNDVNITIDQAFTNFGTRLVEFFGALAYATNFAEEVNNGLTFIADNLLTIFKILGAFAALTVFNLITHQVVILHRTIGGLVGFIAAAPFQIGEALGKIYVSLRSVENATAGLHFIRNLQSGINVFATRSAFLLTNLAVAITRFTGFTQLHNQLLGVQRAFRRAFTGDPTRAVGAFGRILTNVHGPVFRVSAELGRAAIATKLWQAVTTGANKVAAAFTARMWALSNALAALPARALFAATQIGLVFARFAGLSVLQTQLEAVRHTLRVAFAGSNWVGATAFGRILANVNSSLFQTRVATAALNFHLATTARILPTLALYFRLFQAQALLGLTQLSLVFARFAGLRVFQLQLEAVRFTLLAAFSQKNWRGAVFFGKALTDLNTAMIGTRVATAATSLRLAVLSNIIPFATALFIRFGLALRDSITASLARATVNLGRFNVYLTGFGSVLPALTARLAAFGAAVRLYAVTAFYTSVRAIERFNVYLAGLGGLLPVISARLAAFGVVIRAHVLTAFYTSITAIERFNVFLAGAGNLLPFLANQFAVFGAAVRLYVLTGFYSSVRAIERFNVFLAGLGNLLPVLAARFTAFGAALRGLFLQGGALRAISSFNLRLLSINTLTQTLRSGVTGLTSAFRSLSIAGISAAFLSLGKRIQGTTKAVIASSAALVNFGKAAKGASAATVALGTASAATVATTKSIAGASVVATVATAGLTKNKIGLLRGLVSFRRTGLSLLGMFSKIIPQIKFFAIGLAVLYGAFELLDKITGGFLRRTGVKFIEFLSRVADFLGFEGLGDVLGRVSDVRSLGKAADDLAKLTKEVKEFKEEISPGEEIRKNFNELLNLRSRAFKSILDPAPDVFTRTNPAYRKAQQQIQNQQNITTQGNQFGISGFVQAGGQPQLPDQFITTRAVTPQTYQSHLREYGDLADAPFTRDGEEGIDQYFLAATRALAGLDNGTFEYLETQRVFNELIEENAHFAGIFREGLVNLRDEYRSNGREAVGLNTDMDDYNNTMKLLDGQLAHIIGTEEELNIARKIARRTVLGQETAHLELESRLISLRENMNKLGLTQKELSVREEQLIDEFIKGTDAIEAREDALENLISFGTGGEVFTKLDSEIFKINQGLQETRDYLIEIGRVDAAASIRDLTDEQVRQLRIQGRRDEIGLTNKFGVLAQRLTDIEFLKNSTDELDRAAASTEELALQQEYLLLQAAGADTELQKYQLSMLALDRATGLTAETVQRLREALKAGFAGDEDLTGFAKFLDDLRKEVEKGPYKDLFKGLQDSFREFVKTGKTDFDSLIDHFQDKLIDFYFDKAVLSFGERFLESNPNFGSIDSIGGFLGAAGNFLGFGGGGDTSATSSTYKSSDSVIGDFLKNLPGNNFGSNFQIDGNNSIPINRDSIDNRVVPVRANLGENIQVTPRGKRPESGTRNIMANITINTPDADGVKKSEAQIRRMLAQALNQGNTGR